MRDDIIRLGGEKDIKGWEGKKMYQRRSQASLRGQKGREGP